MFKRLQLGLVLLGLSFGLQNIADAQGNYYLALGDSYTIGEKVEEHSRWPAILVGRLNEIGYSFARPDILAKTGWTTGELLNGITEAEALRPSYDLVSLLIGVNNQYRGYDIEIFKEEFEELLTRAIQLAGNVPEHVIVLSVPDYGVTPFAREKNPGKISEEIDSYNNLKRSIAQQKGVLFVDITSISRLAAEDETLLAKDNLHPSGTMYKMWVDKVLTILLSEMENWKISNRLTD